MLEATAKVFAALSETSLLLVQDKRLPSVAGIIAGEALAASWWSHPKGQLIFDVLSELADHDDVLFVKLLHGKVTLVHRKLWPALLAAVSKGEPWQLEGLSEAARELLASVPAASGVTLASGPPVKELEKRLLVHSEETHTETGKHAMALQTWSSWAKRAHVKPLRASAAAKRQIEEAVESIGGALRALPWQRTAK
jgi:hypothetical protein